MTRKHKGTKHEEARKAVPASAARPPSKAVKPARQAEPHPAELPHVEESFEAGTRWLLPSDKTEQSTHGSFEIQGIEPVEGEPERHFHHVAEAEEAITDAAHSFLKPYLPMNRRDAASSSDRDPDLVYRCAEEQVALAMLEAEQAAALCELSGGFSPLFYSEDSFGPARPHRFVPGSVSKASVASMDSASEDGPFAFDHI